MLEFKYTYLLSKKIFIQYALKMIYMNRHLCNSYFVFIHVGLRNDKYTTAGKNTGPVTNTYEDLVLLHKNAVYIIDVFLNKNNLKRNDISLIYIEFIPVTPFELTFFTNNTNRVPIYCHITQRVIYNVNVL